MLLMSIHICATHYLDLHDMVRFCQGFTDAICYPIFLLNQVVLYATLIVY